MRAIAILPISDELPEVDSIRTALLSRFPGEVHVVETLEALRIAGATKFVDNLVSKHRPALVILAASAAALKRNVGYVKILCAEMPSEVLLFVAMDTSAAKMMGEMRGKKSIPILSAPVQLELLIPHVLAALESAPIERADSFVPSRLPLNPMIGESEAFRRVTRLVPRIAGSEETVLIMGETGTGKEVVARAIHYLGPRKDKPFIPVNCGALPTDLMENELFGHREGAYTNASDSVTGMVEEAAGGTLLLDEVESLSRRAQGKLLRFLEEKEFKPLGSAKVQKADVRVISATNVDLYKSVQMGHFREDLLYRLNAFPLYLPPLRERHGDILLLARHFLKQHSAEASKSICGFSPEVESYFERKHWRGNVRELQHVVKRAVLFADGEYITMDEVSIPGLMVENENWVGGDLPTRHDALEA
jgi:two-component system, NtrC family, response regulator GlrR